MIWKDKLLWGDCKEIVATLPDNCVDCVVTSPPYWNLRDCQLPHPIEGGACKSSS